MRLTYGSVCSGVEAASMAWEPLGMTPSWFAEIEKFPSAVLRHHWPLVPNVGDMTNIVTLLRAEAIPKPDILVGGTPCQAFSVAGLRGGLEDARGQLTLEFIRIANELEQDAVIVWENVPGVLSSKDNAFGCLLAGLAGEDDPLEPPREKWSHAGYVLGPSRAVAWRVLDAQYFGLAQRRKRVFVVASARDGFDPAKVLFEFEGARRDTPPSRETGQSVTAGSSGRAGSDRKAVGAIGARDVEEGALTAVRPITDRATRHGGRTGVGSGNGLGVGTPSDPSPTLTKGDRHSVSCGKVRKLMPVEAERLQGMPDNHTQVPYGGKSAEECPDGPRYEAIGNSMAVPVMRWIGERIVDNLENKN